MIAATTTTVSSAVTSTVSLTVSSAAIVIAAAAAAIAASAQTDVGTATTAEKTFSDLNSDDGSMTAAVSKGVIKTESEVKQECPDTPVSVSDHGVTIKKEMETMEEDSIR